MGPPIGVVEDSRSVGRGKPSIEADIGNHPCDITGARIATAPAAATAATDRPRSMLPATFSSRI